LANTVTLRTKIFSHVLSLMAASHLARSVKNQVTKGGSR